MERVGWMASAGRGHEAANLVGRIERHALPVADQMALAPALGPIGGIRTGLVTPVHPADATTVHDRPRPINLVVPREPIQERKVDQISHARLLRGVGGFGVTVTGYPDPGTSSSRAQPEQPLAALGAEHGQRLVTASLCAPKDLSEARVVAEGRQPGVVQQRFRDGVTTVNRLT